jgi:integrase
MAIRRVAEAHGRGEGYCAEYRDEAGVRRHKHFKRKKDAEEAVNLGKVNRQRSRAGLPVERASIKYGEYVSRYLDGHNVSANTMRVLRDRLNVTVRVFGDVPLGDLRSEVIRSAIANLPTGARRKGDVLKAMRQVLSRAVEDGYLQRNPARHQAAPVPRVEPTDVRPFKSWKEIYSLASVVHPRDGAIIIVACGTGIRPEEWIGLEWG